MHFKKIGITFEKYQILDRRMPDCDQGRAIENASGIFLSGGDTLAQIDYIKAQGLLEPLRSHGYVIRYERRCNNMAKRSVILTNPYPERTWVYKGIGLVDLTVIAHFERYDYGFIESEIMPLTRDGVIYGIRDDAAIMVRDGRIRHGGMIYNMAHGQKQLIGTG